MRRRSASCTNSWMIRWWMDAAWGLFVCMNVEPCTHDGGDFYKGMPTWIQRTYHACIIHVHNFKIRHKVVTNVTAISSRWGNSNVQRLCTCMLCSTVLCIVIAFVNGFSIKSAEQVVCGTVCIPFTFHMRKHITHNPFDISTQASRCRYAVAHTVQGNPWGCTLWWSRPVLYTQQMCGLTSAWSVSGWGSGV